MKKIIALLLALIMTFSVATVAFATDGGEVALPEVETTTPADGEEGSVTDSLDEMLGDYKWILDLPFETVGPALWFAKMALKIVIAYVSICNKLGLDPEETAKGIIEWVTKLVEENKPADEEIEEPTTDAIVVF